jgi:hypothetical protein
MARNHPNEGVQQSGGTINAGQLAVGRSARNVKIVTADVAEALHRQGRGAIEGPLEALEIAVKTDGPALPQAGQMLTDVSNVAAEVMRPKADKTTIGTLLQRIGEAAKAVSSIVKAVEVLKGVVALVL